LPRRGRGSLTAPGTSRSGMWPRCGRCWSASAWRGSWTRCSLAAGGTQRRRSGPTSPWPRRTGRRPVLETEALRLVESHGRRSVGAASRVGAGSPAALGGHGRHLREPAQSSRAAHRDPHGRGPRRRRVGSGAGHDEPRHLHRLHQRPGADRPAGPRQAEADRPRIVALGLVVSTDGGIPRVSHAYRRRSARCGSSSPSSSPRSSPASGPSVPVWAGSPSSMTPARAPTKRHPDSRARRCTTSARSRRATRTCSPAPSARCRAVDQQRLPGLSALATTRVVLGVERRVVVTHSEPARQAAPASTRPSRRAAVSSQRSGPASPGAGPASSLESGRPDQPDDARDLSDPPAGSRWSRRPPRPQWLPVGRPYEGLGARRAGHDHLVGIRCERARRRTGRSGSQGHGGSAVDGQVGRDTGGAPRRRAIAGSAAGQ